MGAHTKGSTMRINCWEINFLSELNWTVRDLKHYLQDNKEDRLICDESELNLILCEVKDWSNKIYLWEDFNIVFLNEDQLKYLFNLIAYEIQEAMDRRYEESLIEDPSEQYG